MSELVGVQNPAQEGEVKMTVGTPVIYDGLQKNNFKIFFPNMPHVAFSLQSFNLPAIRINEVSQPTRYVDINEIGEKLVFEPYEVTFIVDKTLRNYVEVFHWMKRMTVAGSNVGEVQDAILFINDEEAFQFVGCWPTELSGLEMDSTDAEGELVVASVKLNYDFLTYIGRYKTNDSSFENIKG